MIPGPHHISVRVAGDRNGARDERVLPTQSDWTGRGVFATRPALRETNPTNSTPPARVRGRSGEAGEGKPTLRGRRVHYGEHSTKIGEGLATG